MADNKKSVLLYCDIIHTVEGLSNEEAGLLFKHYLRYINDLNPEAPDRLTAIVFEPIKQTLKRDLKKWESKSLKNSENANKRWHANASERIKTDANHADSVIVKDNVIVKDKDNNIKNSEMNESQNLLEAYFYDFPNSSHCENIARILKVEKAVLVNALPAFRKAANLSYPNGIKFAEHFKNWYLKQKSNEPKAEVKIKKLGQ